MIASPAPVGHLLREWRRRRHISQLDLALDAEISPRHLSFVETGRSQPSREMILRIAEHLDVPLRERNALLTAGGYAVMFSERPLDDPALASARAAVDLVLKGHEPYPALAIDRHWTLIAANRTVPPLLSGVAPHLLEPPVNVLRISLHPEGLAPRIVNLPRWRDHLIERVRRQVEVSADQALASLLRELQAYPVVEEDRDAAPHEGYSAVAVPFALRTPMGVMSFISTTTVFGTPVDITLAELALESFFPADEQTAQLVQALHRA